MAKVAKTPVMRRWYRGSSTLMLTADSHAEQEDMVFGPEDGPVRVVGTVVWWQAPAEMEEGNGEDARAR